MGKPTICIGENKGTDQLRSNCEADQRLCFRYSNSTIPLLCYVPGVTRRLRKPTSWLASNKLCLKFNKSI